MPSDIPRRPKRNRTDILRTFREELSMRVEELDDFLELKCNDLVSLAMEEEQISLAELISIAHELKENLHHGSETITARMLTRIIHLDR